MKYTKTQQCRDWKFIWDTPEGRRAVAALFDECGLYKPIMANDPHLTAFNEGRRNVALDIVAFLKLKPEQFEDIAGAIQETFNE